jgi:transcription elongation factor Elf1
MFNCPACNASEATGLGFLGNLFHLRCRHCGFDFTLDADAIEWPEHDELDDIDIPSDITDPDDMMPDHEADAQTLRMAGWGRDEDEYYFHPGDMDCPPCCFSDEG